MKINKQTAGILAAILVILLIFAQPGKQTEIISVAPDLSSGGCFEKADCFVPIKQEYCNVRFDCIAGRCQTEDVLCPEICDSGKDEDLDGKTDCSDNDCWSSPLCSCSLASFNVCNAGTCYCPGATEPRWFTGTPNYCACT